MYIWDIGGIEYFGFAFKSHSNPGEAQGMAEEFFVTQVRVHR